MARNKLKIGITMGDPASIGPEITIKALANHEVYEKCKPVVIGDASVLQEAVVITGHEEMIINPIKCIEKAKFKYPYIDVFDMGLVNISDLRRGKVSAMCGNAAFQYVVKTIQLAMDGSIDATVTNALNKEAINLAGHHYSGHTEIYAEYTSTKHYTMMLAYENLKVTHVSTHVSLREACDRVKKERVLEVIRMAWKACRDLGIERPFVGVAGLNPHSGENGLFGCEEIEEIIPAIKEARKEGMNVDGPISPDTIFSKARGGWYDIVVAMYHDQGHIPLKVIGFVYDQSQMKWKSVAGVNITLGLPIIRVSVDHGTAFDQVGRGMASEHSLVNAIEYAIQLAQAEKINKK